MVAPWWPKLTELQGPVADPVNTAGINLTGDPALGGLLGRRGTGKCETKGNCMWSQAGVAGGGGIWVGLWVSKRRQPREGCTRQGACICKVSKVRSWGRAGTEGRRAR